MVAGKIILEAEDCFTSLRSVYALTKSARNDNCFLSLRGLFLPEAIFTKLTIGASSQKDTNLIVEDFSSNNSRDQLIR